MGTMGKQGDRHPPRRSAYGNAPHSGSPAKVLERPAQVPTLPEALAPSSPGGGVNRKCGIDTGQGVGAALAVKAVEPAV